MITNPIEKLVLEWAYRCKKGYPDMNNLEDKKVLEEIMKEWDITEQEESKQGEDTLPDFNKLQLPKDDIENIKAVYESLSEDQQRGVNQNYRKYTLSQFISNSKKLAKVFEPFYEISKSKGRGRGEFIPLMAIAGAKSGGTSQKDIIVDSNILEVKELDKSGKFLTGKSGSIRKSKLSNAIETFCRYLNDLQIEPGTNPIIDQVLVYYEQQYVSNNISEEFIQNIAKAVEELGTIDSGELAKDLEYIKVGDRRFEIPAKQGGYAPGDTIVVGKELQLPEIALQKLKKHEITKNPKVLYTYFTEIVDSYLFETDYFCIYKLAQPESLEVYTGSELKSKLRTNYISVVQGNVRLELSK